MDKSYCYQIRGPDFYFLNMSISLYLSKIA